MMRTAVALFAAMLSCAGVARAADWPLFGQNAAHSGVSPDKMLTEANVSSLQVRWHIALSAVADTAPIVVGNRLFITDLNGTTYGVDTLNGNILWRFSTTGPNITTSVPAFDETTHALYVGGVDGSLHKLNPDTGAEATDGGFPAVLTLAPQTEKNASPLTVANGYLYAQTSGYIGDGEPYVGHLVAINLSNGTKKVFNTLCAGKRMLIQPSTCAAQRSGMWSRAGIVVDPDPTMDGRIYAASGNAPFAANSGSYGDTILSLTGDASNLIGYLTPSNYQQLYDDDLDVGSSSPALLPRVNGAIPLLAVQGGKYGTLELFDRSHLAKLGAPLQTISLGAGLFSAPAVWKNGGAIYVFIGLGDGVHAFSVVTKSRQTSLQAAWTTSLSMPNEGSSPTVAGGMIFIATNTGLVALDGPTGKQLWAGTALGSIHWQSPAIAGAAIYCSDESGNLTAYALPPT